MPASAATRGCVSCRRSTPQPDRRFPAAREPGAAVPPWPRQGAPPRAAADGPRATDRPRAPSRSASLHGSPTGSAAARARLRPARMSAPAQRPPAPPEPHAPSGAAREQPQPRTAAAVPIRPKPAVPAAERNRSVPPRPSAPAARARIGCVLSPAMLTPTPGARSATPARAVRQGLPIQGLSGWDQHREEQRHREASQGQPHRVQVSRGQPSQHQPSQCQPSQGPPSQGQRRLHDGNLRRASPQGVNARASDAGHDRPHPLRP
jgi:hypothetical protein